jgi:hypothetical protein
MLASVHFSCDENAAVTWSLIVVFSHLSVDTFLPVFFLFDRLNSRRESTVASCRSFLSIFVSGWSVFSLIGGRSAVNKTVATSRFHFGRVLMT